MHFLQWGSIFVKPKKAEVFLSKYPSRGFFFVCVCVGGGCFCFCFFEFMSTRLIASLGAIFNVSSLTWACPDHIFSIILNPNLDEIQAYEYEFTDQFISPSTLCHPMEPWSTQASLSSPSADGLFFYLNQPSSSLKIYP